MRIVAVSRLRPGMRLGRPVYSCTAGVQVPLLQPQSVVTERVRAGLERAGVFAVYIDDEMAIVREHPQTGLDMVESGVLASLAKVCIIGHHERLDGRGYPHGRGADLHENAQVAGIADVYDAVSSMRVYQARRPTHEAWELVMSLAGTACRSSWSRSSRGPSPPTPTAWRCSSRTAVAASWPGSRAPSAG